MAIPGTEVDFEIEKEDWNIYNLDDGSIMKMRSVLTRIISSPIQGQMTPPKPKTGPKPAPDLSFNSQFHNIVVVQKAPIGLMGPPDEGPYDLEGAEKIEVGFTAFLEDWNVYRLSGAGIPTGAKIRIKLLVSTIQRVSKLHDQLGYPMYLVSSTNAMVPVAPSTPKRK